MSSTSVHTGNHYSSGFDELMDQKSLINYGQKESGGVPEGPEKRLIKASTELTGQGQCWLFPGPKPRVGVRRVLSKQYLSMAMFKVGVLSLVYFSLLTNLYP